MYMCQLVQDTKYIKRIGLFLGRLIRVTDDRKGYGVLRNNSQQKHVKGKQVRKSDTKFSQVTHGEDDIRDPNHLSYPLEIVLSSYRIVKFLRIID